MRNLPTEKLFLYGVTIAVVAGLAPLLSRIPRSKGRNVLYHALYFVAVGLSLFFIPEWIQHEIFSPGGVLVFGTIIPIYESIVAVCSIGHEDDIAWLQFWIASGTFSFATEFMDNITEYLPQAGEHWYEFEFFLTLWLMLPFTDGSRLIFDVFTKPYLSPILSNMKSKLEGYGKFIFAAVNTSFLWFMWFAFMQLPEEARRFLVVGLGTIYPMIASTVALATECKREEERFWLTYWACYSILFMMMDYLENFVGHIRGFYSLCAVATLWLFLPMFQGADDVFRRVLVPLSGQYENLMLFDAYLVKLGVEESIPANAQERVLSKVADVFSSKSKKTN